MKKLLILLLFAISLGGCKHAGETEKHQKVRDQIIDVHDQIETIAIGDLLIGGFVKLYIVNEYIFVADVKSRETLLHVFDGKSMQYICSGIKNGRGPNEIVTIGAVFADEAQRRFYVPDHGKRVIYDYELDKFLQDPQNYIPNIKREFKKRTLPINSQYITGDELLGKANEPDDTGSYREYMVKWNIATGEITPMPYEQPEIIRRRIDFAVSPETDRYVETYNHHDLMTICDLNGQLKYNIYGPKWDAAMSNRIIYFDKPLFCQDKIIISYSGKVYHSGDWLPTKLMIFSLDGDYIKTLETGYRISDFCYDKENNRLVLAFDDEIQFAYLNLEGII